MRRRAIFFSLRFCHLGRGLGSRLAAALELVGIRLNGSQGNAQAQFIPGLQIPGLCVLQAMWRLRSLATGRGSLQGNPAVTSTVARASSGERERPWVVALGEKDGGKSPVDPGRVPFRRRLIWCLKLTGMYS